MNTPCDSHTATLLRQARNITIALLVWLIGMAIFITALVWTWRLLFWLADHWPI